MRVKNRRKIRVKIEEEILYESKNTQGNIGVKIESLRKYIQ